MAPRHPRTWAESITPEVAKKIASYVPGFPTKLEDFGGDGSGIWGITSYGASNRKRMLFQPASSYCEVCHSFQVGAERALGVLLGLVGVPGEPLMAALAVGGHGRPARADQVRAGAVTLLAGDALVDGVLPELLGLAERRDELRRKPNSPSGSSRGSSGRRPAPGRSLFLQELRVAARALFEMEM